MKKMTATIIDFRTRERITPEGRKRPRLQKKQEQPKQHEDPIKTYTFAEYGWYQTENCNYVLKVKNGHFAVFFAPKEQKWRVARNEYKPKKKTSYHGWYDEPADAMADITDFVLDHNIPRRK